MTADTVRLPLRFVGRLDPWSLQASTGRRLRTQVRRNRPSARPVSGGRAEVFERCRLPDRQPLSRLILDEPIPSRFKMPHVEPYDGSTDPVDHLESYKTLMTIQGAIDALLCIGFSATLRKATRTWYSGLRSRSIHSFGQLEHAFVAHFSTSRKPPRTSDSLFSLK